MRLAVALIAPLALGVCAPAAACPGLMADDAWIRAAPPGATLTAAYARLRNLGEQPLKVDGAASPGFGSAELHRTVVENGVSKMRHGQPLEIAAGGHAALEPGGWHLMLMDPAQPLQAGERVPVSLRCGAESAEFTFVVKAPSE